MNTSAHKSNIVPLIVATAFFMENLDGTVITTALPQMAQTLGVNAVDMSVGITAYLITLAVFIPISGWLSDRLGSQTVFGSAVGIFTFASVLCALSQTVNQFMLARILQGIGGAMMVPVGRLIVLRTTSKSELVKTIALITWPGLVAPVIGPPLGGFLTTYFSWHWIFILNVPLGLLGIGLIRKYVSNDHQIEKRPLDYIGFLIIGSALAFTIIGVESIGSEGFSKSAVGYSALGIACGVTSWFHAKKHPHPLLDFSVLKVPTFGITFFSGSFTRVLIGATPFLAPLMFQIAFGYSAFMSGLLFLAAMLGNIGLKPLTPMLLKRFGFRNIMLGNGFIAAMAAMICGMLSPDTSIIGIVLAMFIYGVSRSMQFTCIQTLAFVDIPPEKMSGANTLFSTIGQLAQGVGVALGAAIVHITVMLRDGDINSPSAMDFRITFFTVGALILISLWGYLKLKPDAGAAASKHQPKKLT
jgi:EmrB/QacA subfamily drug resistance transporter